MKRNTTIIFHYSFSVLAVVLATALRFWLERQVGPMPLFITWYPAVLLVASIGGAGPGIVATLLATATADYWFIPPFGFGIAHANDTVATGLFAGTGIFVSLLAERLRRTRWADAVRATQEQELALLNMGNVMALDLDHHIIRWSEGNRRLYGFDAQEVQGKVTFEVLQTHLSQPLDEIHRELFKNGHWQGEVTRHTKYGTLLSLTILWALRRDAKGKPLAILEVSTDLTTQKTAENALREQSEELARQNEELQAQSEEVQTLNTELIHKEKTLQTLLTSARLPMGEQEVMGKVCEAAMEIIGQLATGAVVCERDGDQLKILAHAGFNGAPLPAIWPLKGSFIELILQHNQTACLEDTSCRPDLTLLPASGQPRFPAVLTAPLRLRGDCVGAVSIYSSTPQSWTAEQFALIEWLASQCSTSLESIRLKEEILLSQTQNSFLANILETSSQPFGVGYPDGHLGLINRAFEQLTGYTGDELRAIDWAGVLTPPEWQDIERQKLEELNRTGMPVRYEKEYIRKDGGRVPIELLVHLVREVTGQPLYYYSFLTDITERKRAEESLRQTTEELRRSNKDLEQFAYVTSHDLKEPLRMVTSFTSLLRDQYHDQFDARANEYMTFASDAAVRMQTLIDDLLAYARVGRDKTTTASSSTEAMDEAEANLRLSIEEAGATVTRDPLPTVQANTLDLTQLFQNLLGNAIKFRRPGVTPEVHVSASPADKGWLFSVRDNGIGIEPQYADKIFEIFQRLHTREAYAGTGVGLAICKKIVERYGGRIWVESKPDQGSTFYFTLPA